MQSVFELLNRPPEDWNRFVDFAAFMLGYDWDTFDHDYLMAYCPAGENAKKTEQAFDLWQNWLEDFSRNHNS